MADRLFQTISSGRPYHVVKGNDSNRATVTAKRVDRKTCEPTISGADRQWQRSHVSCAEGAGNTRVNVFDIEAQQHDSGRPLTTKSHLLRLQSKITIGANSVNNNQLDKPRMSLLGRPVGQNRRHRTTRENRHRRYQFVVNNFLERPNGRLSVLYHLFV